MSPDSLLALAADLRQGRQPDPSAAAELAAAIERWTEGEDLDAALGLKATAAGARHARTIYRQGLRDHHLRAAYRLLDGPEGHRRTVRLHAEVERFTAVIWPAWKGMQQPPERASQLRRELFHAAKAARLPVSLSGLRNSLSGT